MRWIGKRVAGFSDHWDGWRSELVCGNLVALEDILYLLLKYPSSDNEALAKQIA